MAMLDRFVEAQEGGFAVDILGSVHVMKLMSSIACSNGSQHALRVWPANVKKVHELKRPTNVWAESYL